MKEFMALLGFGTGMVVGVMLYKHSQDFKKSVDNSFYLYICSIIFKNCRYY